MLLLFCLVTAPSARADDLELIRFGESALSFAAGAVTKSFPQDGVVNVTTGDNQTTGDRMELGQRDTLYLRLRNPDGAAIGDLFTIFKRARKVFHPATGEYLGYVVVRVAIVEVTQVDKALTTVRVVRAYGAINPGDPVVKFSLPVDEEPAQNVSPDDIAGMLIEVQSDMSMTLVAQRNIVYVDRGRADGVRVGDIMEVIRSGGNLPPRVIGEIKILSAQEKTASALITRSTSRLFKGDRFRMKTSASELVPISGPVQPPSPPSSELSTTTQNGPRNLPIQQASRDMKITLSDLMKQLRYESGEAKIQPEGYQVLDELIQYLKTASAEQLVRVEGHADNMEIGPTLKSRYPTNWDLSKARASGVLRYLVEKGGIDSARISSVGYGDTKPVVSNATEAGRQRNRRVDIVLYQPEPAKSLPEQTMMPGSTDHGDKVRDLASADQNGTVSPVEQAQPSSKPRTESSMPAPVEPAGQTASTSDQVSGQSLSPRP
jgi:chemotaxis protein MotB